MSVYQPVGIGMKPCTTKLARFIRSRRLSLGLSQRAFAEKLGVSQSFISELEMGKQRSFRFERLTTWAKILGCSREELVKRMPKKPTPVPLPELGRLIRSRRKKLGLSMADFAKRLGVDLKQARSWERRRPTPSLRRNSAILLAKALELEPSAFFKFVGFVKKETTSKLGSVVRERRKELGLSQVELAKRLGVSRQVVSQIELGKCCLSLEGGRMIERLAGALGLDVEVLQAVRPKRRPKEKKHS